MFYVYVIYTNIMNVLRTGMNMSISRIHIWLCYSSLLYIGILLTERAATSERSSQRFVQR